MHHFADADGSHDAFLLTGLEPNNGHKGGAEKVSLAQYPDELAAVYHRHVADPTQIHHVVGEIQDIVASESDRRFGHDLFNRRFFLFARGHFLVTLSISRDITARVSKKYASTRPYQNNERRAVVGKNFAILRRSIKTFPSFENLFEFAFQKEASIHATFCQSSRGMKRALNQGVAKRYDAMRIRIESVARGLRVKLACSWFAAFLVAPVLTGASPVGEAVREVDQAMAIVEKECRYIVDPGEAGGEPDDVATREFRNGFFIRQVPGRKTSHQLLTAGRVASCTDPYGLEPKRSEDGFVNPRPLLFVLYKKQRLTAVLRRIIENQGQEVALIEVALPAAARPGYLPLLRDADFFDVGTRVLIRGSASLSDGLFPRLQEALIEEVRDNEVQLSVAAPYLAGSPVLVWHEGRYRAIAVLSHESYGGEEIFSASWAARLPNDLNGTLVTSQPLRPRDAETEDDLCRVKPLGVSSGGPD
jgi:hypothetical protein